jgi:dihydropteroate synthase
MTRILKIGDKKFDLDKQTLLMGILNVTPDSFSDGGKFFSLEKAVSRAIEIERNGADIIDIGGESTRPGALPITAEEELRRITPVLEKLVRKISIPISVDTYKYEVAKRALELGADMINDISALRKDERMAELISDYNVPICLMHMKGTPREMQKNPFYKDVVAEIKEFLEKRIDYAVSKGIKKENIIVDPGIGFGKRTGEGIEDNCEILLRLKELKILGQPILIGVSRKTFIGNVCGEDKQLPVDQRLEGSLAAMCIAVMNGADIVRMHDVLESKRCLRLIDRVLKS